MNWHQRVLSEFLGTMGLLVIVVGSGIMAENLSAGNTAIALLANSVATGAGLYALIQCFGAISGAHFNPVVSFVERLAKRLTTGEFLVYSAAQIVGAVMGVLLAHAMFGLRLFQLSHHDRGDLRFLLSEGIATFGLLMVILQIQDRKAAPSGVALYITSAYWCTSSTAFANPAVSIARSFTDSFSGILWSGVPGFIIVQLLGAALALRTANYLRLAQIGSENKKGGHKARLRD